MSVMTLAIAATFLSLITRCAGSVPTAGVATPCCRDHEELKQRALLGCPYPGGSVWQTSVARAPIDAHSSAWIAATIAGGGGGGFIATVPTYEQINDADNSTPLVPVQAKVKWHTPYSPIPWKQGFYVEPLSDGHSLVLQRQSCQYYEGYDTTYSPNGTLSVYNNMHVDLRKPFVRPRAGGSTASGIPIGLVAVRPEELAAGVIHHVLGWDAVAGSLSQTACVSPALVANCTDDLPYRASAANAAMPYGAHARLKRSFNIDGFSREAKVVAQAMKTYGLFVYDTGCCNRVVFVNDHNGAPVWTSADSSDLGRISPSDFDIVPPR